MSTESAARFLPPIRKFNKKNVPRPAIDELALQRFLQEAQSLSVEIGCGVGLHPVNWALKNPERSILAIEKTAEKYKKFEKRYTESGQPKNLYPLHAHAVSIVTYFLADASVDQYFLLFPNPEVKSPQSRWIRMPFFSEILRTLKSNGKIHFATNEKFYFDEIEEYATQVWSLKVVERQIVRDTTAVTARTHFEKKYLERGQTIYSIILEKSLGEQFPEPQTDRIVTG